MRLAVVEEVPLDELVAGCCHLDEHSQFEAELERIASLEPAAADTEVEEEEAQTEAEPEPAAPPVDRATLDRKLNGTWAEVCPPKVTVAV